MLEGERFSVLGVGDFFKMKASEKEREKKRECFFVLCKEPGRFFLSFFLRALCKFISFRKALLSTPPGVASPSLFSREEEPACTLSTQAHARELAKEATEHREKREPRLPRDQNDGD